MLVSVSRCHQAIVPFFTPPSPFNAFLLMYHCRVQIQRALVSPKTAVGRLGQRRPLKKCMCVIWDKRHCTDSALAACQQNTNWLFMAGPTSPCIRLSAPQMPPTAWALSCLRARVCVCVVELRGDSLAWLWTAGDWEKNDGSLCLSLSQKTHKLRQNAVYCFQKHTEKENSENHNECCHEKEVSKEKLYAPYYPLNKKRQGRTTS